MKGLSTCKQTGKLSFYNKSRLLKYITLLERDGKPPYFYKCTHCHAYHLTKCHEQYNLVDIYEEKKYSKSTGKHNLTLTEENDDV